MSPRSPWHRIGAFLIDYLLARMLAVVLFAALYSFSGSPVSARLQAGIVEAMTALLLITLSAHFIDYGRRSPGKRLFGLKVEGTGCATCREFRRLWPLLLFAAVMIVTSDEIAPLPNNPVLQYIYPAPILFMVFFFHWVPLMSRLGPMPYDRSTGFDVVERS